MHQSTTKTKRRKYRFADRETAEREYNRVSHESVINSVALAFIANDAKHTTLRRGVFTAKIFHQRTRDILVMSERTTTGIIVSAHEANEWAQENRERYSRLGYLDPDDVERRNHRDLVDDVERELNRFHALPLAEQLTETVSTF